MMTTPTDLTTNQSEECPRADHNLLFEPLLENVSLLPPGQDTQFGVFCFVLFLMCILFANTGSYFIMQDL